MNIAQIIKTSRNLVKYSALGLAAAAMLGVGTHANAEPPVTSGLVLSLDASALTGLSDGAQVDTWTDTSTSANNATATGSAATYQTGTLNGNPVVRFNTDANASFTFTEITTIRTVFWVVKNTTPGMHFLLGDSDAYDFHAGEVGEIWHSGWTSDYIKNGTTKLMGTAVDGTVTTLPYDSYSLVSLVTTGNVRANRLTLDRTYGRSWSGDMAEILIYDKALTTEEEALVGGYLAAKYGLTTVYPPPGPPPAPTGLVAIPLHQSVRLDWTAPASFGITGYKVDRLLGSGLGIDATYDVSGVTSYTDTTVTSGGPYYYVVRAVNSAGAGAYSSEASASPSAGPVNQTITFALGLAVTKTAADAAFADTASASPSGLSVTYSSDNLAVATVHASTGEVTLTGVPGTAHILADQAGNDDFNAATQVSQTLTVSQAMPVITWAPTPIVVGTLLSGTQLNATSGGVAGEFVYSPPIDTALPVGTHTLSVQFTPANTVKYSIPEAKTVELLVVPVETTVIWNTGDGTWDTAIPNWKGNDSGQPTIFIQGNDVIFNSTAGGTIAIASGMEPASTTVSATSGDYTFTGGPIATGSLTKSGNGNLTLAGNNTYSGGTIINSGQLMMDQAHEALGTGAVTLNGGLFFVSNIDAVNALIVNGGNIHTDGGWGGTWSGPVTLNADLNIDVPYYDAFWIMGNISGPGGIMYAASWGGSGGNLALLGANSYTGPTIVNSGTLASKTSASLGHTSVLNIASGAKVLLAYTGDQRVASLILGGVRMPPGTYGSSSSTAPVANQNDTYFATAGSIYWQDYTGTGTVTVPPPSGTVILIY